MAGEYDQTTAFLQGIATNALTQASNNAGRIYSLPPNVSLRNPRFDVKLDKPNIGPPPTFSDLFSSTSSTDPTMLYLNNQAKEWMTEFFPAMTGDFKNVPEENLIGILSGVKPFGIDKTIFEMVWQQARDRAVRTVDSEQRTIEASFSARGFSLPPGAMIDAQMQVERRATDAALDVSREQAIKDADIKQRMLELALQLSTQLKLGMLSALADFYRMWITLPDKDIERERIKAQAMASLYGALSSYHNVEIAFQELSLKAAQLKSGVDIDVDRNAVSRQGNVASTAGALGQAVGAMARVAGDAATAGGTFAADIKVS